jgi:hypothetical protein
MKSHGDLICVVQKRDVGSVEHSVVVGKGGPKPG